MMKKLRSCCLVFFARFACDLVSVVSGTCRSTRYWYPLLVVLNKTILTSSPLYFFSFQVDQGLLYIMGMSLLC